MEACRRECVLHELLVSYPGRLFFVISSGYKAGKLLAGVAH